MREAKICMMSDDSIEIVGKSGRLGFCIAEPASWFAVTADGGSSSGYLSDPALCAAIAQLLKETA